MTVCRRKPRFSMLLAYLRASRRSRKPSRCVLIGLALSVEVFNQNRNVLRCLLRIILIHLGFGDKFLPVALAQEAVFATTFYYPEFYFLLNRDTFS